MSDTIEKLTTLDQKFEYLNYSDIDRAVFLFSHLKGFKPIYDLDNVHADLNEQISEKNGRMV